MLTQKNGKCLVVNVLPTSLVINPVINIRAKAELWLRNVILLLDSADTEEARRWRVWFKLGVKA